MKIKEDCHEKVMTKPVENTLVLDQQLFKKVVDKLGLSCAKLRAQLSSDLS